MVQPELHTAPLQLFWWKGVANFGDALSAIVVAHMCGREVVHRGPGMADLYAVGSLLQIARRKFSEKKTYSNRPWIWGSGLLHPVPQDFLVNVHIALLRGPITASLLGIKTDQFGDPGLLIAEILPAAPAKTHRIGLVPHHSQVADPEIVAIAQSSDEFLLIDPTQDAATVCGQISACDQIYASSLHGLITADSYGVPSTWVSPGDQAHLKYHDYAASIGRPMISPLAWDQIPTHAKTKTKQAELPYRGGIARAKAALRNSFPAHLCAIQNIGPA